MGYLVSRFLRYYDFSPSFVQKAIRRLSDFVSSILYKLRFLTSSILLPARCYLVNVSDICICNITKRTENSDIYSKYLYHGVVLKGDWDLDHELIETVPIFEFSYKVFKENMEMEETKYYQQILAGNIEPYIQGEDHLRLRLNKYIKLFEQIRDSGYQPQKKIKGGNFLDEVCISIDRNGHYILEEGRHRFMIAKCLNLETIPVIINRVHEDHWKKMGNHWDEHLQPCS